MIENKLNLPWLAPYGPRWETITPELLKLMKKEGYYRVLIGVEIGSPRLQQVIRKNIPLDRLKERSRASRSAGVSIMGNFMYGFPGESRDELKKTFSCALELDLDFARFYIYTPYPGSELYDELIGERNIDPDDFQMFDKFDYANHLSEATPKELFWLVQQSLLAFYFRPRMLRKLIANLRYPDFYTVIFKLLYYEFLFLHRTQEHSY